MNPLVYIELGLAGLRIVLDQLGQQKVAGTDVSGDIAIVQGAIDALMKVHGSPTTLAQLEASRTQKLW